MKARRVVVGVAAAAAMVAGGGVSASANILWCMDDPPVQVQTPAGTNLTVGVTVAVPQHEAKYISQVQTQAVTAPDGAGGTLITVVVTVPSTISVAKVTIAVAKFKGGSNSATVPGGATTTLQLDVPAA